MYMLDTSSLPSPAAPPRPPDLRPPPIPGAEKGSSSASSHLASDDFCFAIKRLARAGAAESKADERLVESTPESGRGRRMVESNVESRANAGCAA